MRYLPAAFIALAVAYAFSRDGAWILGDASRFVAYVCVLCIVAVVAIVMDERVNRA